jgi:6-phosphogluconolactonase/glucosamine-6-phosphate isomerase/deaminase
VAKKDLSRLTVTLSDERYGDVGHKDSNWQQLLDKGFDITNVQVLPVLVAGPTEYDLEKTKEEFSIKVKKAYNKADIIIGQLGIGTDGHIAGVLPESRGVVDTSVAVAYEANDYKRITLTLKMIKKMSVIFVFAFGQSKKSVIADLETKDLSMSEMPAQILKQVKDVRIYCE